MNGNGVERAVDVRERITLGHQSRMNAEVERAGVGPLCDCERSNDIAEAPSVLDVPWVDLIDALGRNLLRQHVRTKRKPGDQRELVARIATSDVERGVGLGKPGFLRGLERVGKRGAFVGHARKNVVAGAVDDAPDGAKLIGRERLANHADDWDRASHGRLEVEVAPVGFRECEQRRTPLCEQRLVRGDHVLLRLEGRAHQSVRHFHAADELHDDVDVVAFRDLECVVEQRDGRVFGTDHLEARGVFVRHRSELDGRPRPRADHLRMFVERRHEAFANHAAAAQSNPNFAIHST